MFYDANRLIPTPAWTNPKDKQMKWMIFKSPQGLPSRLEVVLRSCSVSHDILRKVEFDSTKINVELRGARYTMKMLPGFHLRIPHGE